MPDMFMPCVVWYVLSRDLRFEQIENRKNQRKEFDKALADFGLRLSFQEIAWFPQALRPALCAVLVLAFGANAKTCLPNGIPEQNRLYVSNATDQPSPIRFVTYNWDSARVINHVAEILVSEVLGFHVLRDPGIFFWATDGILKLAGCHDMACAEPNANAPRADVLLDTWLSAGSTTLKQFQAKKMAQLLRKTWVLWVMKEERHCMFKGKSEEQLSLTLAYP